MTSQRKVLESNDDKAKVAYFLCHMPSCAVLASVTVFVAATRQSEFFHGNCEVVVSYTRTRYACACAPTAVLCLICYQNFLNLFASIFYLHLCLRLKVHSGKHW